MEEQATEGQCAMGMIHPVRPSERSCFCSCSVGRYWGCSGATESLRCDLISQSPIVCVSSDSDREIAVFKKSKLNFTQEIVNFFYRINKLYNRAR